MVVSQVWPQEGTQEGLRKTTLSHEKGGRHTTPCRATGKVRSERKIKARTFTGARKIRKGRIKFEIG